MAKRFTAPLWVSAASTAMIVSQFAVAQDAKQAGASATSEEAQPGELVTIVVTAERRSTNLQRTPIAIQAIDGRPWRR